MDSNKTRYVVVGGVLWAALIILVGGMLFLNEKDLRQKLVHYYVMFDQVSTLGKGDPVKVNGVKVGKITEIRLKDRRVQVRLSVLDTVSIPVNSVVRVQNIGILGERQVGILLGDGTSMLSDGDFVEGGFDAGISEVMAYAGEVFDSTRVLLAVVRDVVDSTIGNREFQQSFFRIVSQAEQLEQRLDGLIGSTEPVLKASLHNLHTVSTKLNDVLDLNRPPIEALIDNAADLTQDARQLMAQANTLAGKLEMIVAKLEAKDNTVGLLLQDDSFYKEMNQVVQSADTLLRSVLKDGLDINIDFF